jgi:hypothetical protein
MPSVETGFAAFSRVGLPCCVYSCVANIFSLFDGEKRDSCFFPSKTLFEYIFDVKYFKIIVN